MTDFCHSFPAPEQTGFVMQDANAIRETRTLSF